MIDLEQFINKTASQTETTFENLPDIDLYMDQVIEYLARQCSYKEDGERLSGAMINNYIKDKILPRANGKKYSKNHLACLIMIARLKQVLSVKDIGNLLSGVPEDSVNEYFDIFQKILYKDIKKLGESFTSAEGDLRLKALDLAVTAYVNKAACEIILDSLNSEQEN